MYLASPKVRGNGVAIGGGGVVVLAAVACIRSSSSSGHGGSHGWRFIGRRTHSDRISIGLGDAFPVMITQGPLVPEHLLLIPVAHTASLTRLSSQGFHEFEQWKKSLQRWGEGPDEGGGGEGVGVRMRHKLMSSILLRSLIVFGDGILLFHTQILRE